MYSSVSVLSSSAFPVSRFSRPPFRPPPKARTLTLTAARATPAREESPEPAGAGLVSDLRSSGVLRCCPCGRRLSLLGTMAVAVLPDPHSNASGAGPSDPEAVVEKFHPSRPDWYEELYANALELGARSYEAEVAAYKAKLFSQLTEKSKKILELGIGTGPNIKYYASARDINIIGVDPIKKMEKYAQAAAVKAGLPLTNFSFMRGVAEALPVGDDTMDVVIGTLVLCSVKDVDMALREVKRVLKPGGLYIFIEHVAADGFLLRCIQSFLDPLQQFIADGCHLRRETGKLISEAGFSSVDLNSAFLASALFLGPHVYGIARK